MNKSFPESPTEVEVAELVSLERLAGWDIATRLAFQRDRLKAERDELRSCLESCVYQFGIVTHHVWLEPDAVVKRLREAQEEKSETAD